MRTEKIANSFSDEQQIAINCQTKNILLTARAGSGKTKVLTERAKRLLDNGFSKEEILIFAFNNKAVNEINERLNVDIAKTFHSFSNSFANLVEIESGDFFNQMVLKATKKITKKDVENLFELAMIEHSNEDVVEMESHISKMLNYMDLINESSEEQNLEPYFLRPFNSIPIQKDSVKKDENRNEIVANFVKRDESLLIINRVVNKEGEK